MKKISLLLLLSSATSFAGTCSLQASGKTCHSVFDGYATVGGQTTTSSLSINGHHGTISTTTPSYQVATYRTECSYKLQLNLDGDLVYEADRVRDLLDEVEQNVNHGACESVSPADCSVKIEGQDVFLAVNGRSGVRVDRGTLSESLLYVKKIVALLKIKNLCR